MLKCLKIKIGNRLHKFSFLSISKVPDQIRWNSVNWMNHHNLIASLGVASSTSMSRYLSYFRDVNHSCTQCHEMSYCSSYRESTHNLWQSKPDLRGQCQSDLNFWKIWQSSENDTKSLYKWHDRPRIPGRSLISMPIIICRTINSNPRWITSQYIWRTFMGDFLLTTLR